MLSVLLIKQHNFFKKKNRVYDLTLFVTLKTCFILALFNGKCLELKF